MVKHIGRYTHSTAISNNRIISMENDTIAFWFKNTRKKSRWETTTLPTITFIERFLFHVLPKYFHRIRYYGFPANGKAGCRVLADRIEPVLEMAENSDSASQCSVCSKGTMITILVMDGYGNVVKDTRMDAVSKQVPEAIAPP